MIIGLIGLIRVENSDWSSDAWLVLVVGVKVTPYTIAYSDARSSREGRILEIMA